VWCNRGDSGLGQDAIMAWHEAADRPNYLFKLKLFSLVRTALHAVPEADWQGPSILGAWQLAKGQIQFTGWLHPRQVIFALQVQGFVNCLEGWRRRFGYSQD
jgi:hypothetical protein